MSKDPKVRALKIMEELWNKKIPALIDELFATNCVIHIPDGVLHGLEGGVALLQRHLKPWFSSLLSCHIALSALASRDELQVWPRLGHR
jgi:hypothetical protein